jgi:hypothetical protein
VPIPSEVIAGPADPALVNRIAELLVQVRTGDAAFAAAGARQSESWISAQQALSALIATRAPVAKAITDLDALAASRLVATGGIQPGDLQAIQAATAEASAIGDRESAFIDKLQAQLGS